jgi:hypothetical protein
MEKTIQIGNDMFAIGDLVQIDPEFGIKEIGIITDIDPRYGNLTIYWNKRKKSLVHNEQILDQIKKV